MNYSLHSMRSRYIAAVVACLFFAIPILQFGFLQSWRNDRQSEFVNNGASANFFVLHARPYYVFPEDTFLYVVRAKRIVERGWSGDLLWGRDHELTDKVYAAPFQVALGYLAGLTQGHPWSYALFLSTLVFLFWSAFATVALNQLQRQHGYFPVLALSLFIAVTPVPTGMITLAAGYFPTLLPGDADKIWPAYKALRFSTHAWSVPLFIAFSIIAARIARGVPVRFSGRWSASAILLTFAIGDVWSIFMVMGIACLAVVVRVVVLWWRNGLSLILWKAMAVPDIVVLVSSATVAAAVFIALQGGLNPDAVARAGFGPFWLQSTARVGGPTDIWLPRFAWVFGFFLLVAGGACAFLSRSRALTAALIGGLPLAAAAIGTVSFYVYGADYHQMQQFHDRAFAVVWFSLGLLLWLFVRSMLLWNDLSGERKRRRLRLASRTVAILLMVLMVLHTGRTAIYIKRTALPDLALTGELENLKVTLNELDQVHPRAELVTMSHEINYLAALWTNFDLALPEGFPLHYSGSNDAIARRMAAVLRFYQGTRQSWEALNLRRHPADQLSWLESRLQSERDGYAYYLFHRLDSHAVQGDQAGNSMALVDVELSNARIPAAIRPDIVILDPTSAFVGRPDLSDYIQIMSTKTIEVWLRRDLR